MASSGYLLGESSPPGSTGYSKYQVKSGLKRTKGYAVNILIICAKTKEIETSSFSLFIEMKCHYQIRRHAIVKTSQGKGKCGRVHSMN